MSEDARSVGSVEAVSGKRRQQCWGFPVAFFGAFSGAFPFAFSGAFSGAFAFASAFAGAVLQLTRCNVIGLGVMAVLLPRLLDGGVVLLGGSAVWIEGVECGLDLVLHPRGRDG